MEKRNTLHIGNHVLDIMSLPIIAQEELVTYYQFLIFKYKKGTLSSRHDKQRILSEIFEEANGVLPQPYRFNREEIHER